MYQLANGNGCCVIVPYAEDKHVYRSTVHVSALSVVATIKALYKYSKYCLVTEAHRCKQLA